ncbi:hypothetical protein [Anaeromicrobium sediminis]|uniref:Uncharacterized protein n=1 Tax=Anaeromicrobium sediminis TaxID=1478221 RepID=A0A267MRC1_9FIRM|nr:hypothetical protein [Anaeromicrobium sediminis]PAB61323.1 hypothetical protein CCE28_02505 [Anaeromicrobium sediminis]
MLEKANEYLNNRLFNSIWIECEEPKKQSALDLSQDIIKGEYGEGIKQHKNYDKAVYEEALYLLENENSKRFKLQLQGVKSISVDDASESYKSNANILISPYVKQLLKGKKVMDL